MMKINTHVYSFKDTLLVYALIAQSTIQFFKSRWGIILIIFSLILLHNHILKSIKKESLIVLVVVFLLELYHVTYFENYDIWMFRQIITYFLLAIFVSNYLKLNFLEIYIKIIYITVLVSFFFFGGLLISPTFIHFLEDSTPELFKMTFSQYGGNDITKVNPIIYNFDYNFYKYRNNGPFWEPTVFASLILIGQIFNFLTSKSFFNKTGVIFTIGIITTFSTTVYLAYFILYVSIVLINYRASKISKLFFLLCTFALGFLIFSSLPFLQEKITMELTEVDENIDGRGDSRIAGATLDLIEVSQENIFILFGKGSDRDYRIGGINKTVQRNCGLTALLVEWGIFFFIIYLALLYYSFYKLCEVYKLKKSFALPFTLCIIIVSFSEVFFDLPLFHTFIFLGFVVKKYYRPMDTMINRNNKHESLFLTHVN